VKTDDEVKGAQPPERPAPPERDRRYMLAIFIGLILFVLATGGPPLLIVITAIVLMICLHEFGHYATAKWSGMKVTEYFLGFGPKLWSFKRGETEYGVKAIPAGAYVRVIGMNNLEEVPPEDEPRTYRQQSFPKRLLVVSAGSGMHFILAIVCIFLMLTVTGAPGGHVFQQDNTNWSIVEVVPNSAAAAAGLQPGDRVLSIDGEPIDSYTRMREIVQPRPGKTVTLDVKRGDHTFTTSATLANENGIGKLGVSSQGPQNEKVGVVTAAGRSVSEFGTGVKDSLGALGKLFSPSGIADFASKVRNGGSPAVDAPAAGGAPSSGPSSDDSNRPLSIIGATRIGSDLTAEGLLGFLIFFTGINLFIGIVNMVPLLPLDGGHVAIAVYERIRSRKGKRYQVDVMKLLPLTYAVVMLLIVLFVSTVFLDLVDPISVN
jgi:membrane-associated protease RseP (regulator of RpoE activity)